MTKLSISNEMAAKYPEFAGRVGEAIDNSEYQRVVSDANYAAKEAAKNSKGKPAEAAGIVLDKETGSAPVKTTAPKAAKKIIKRSSK